ncbi:hypothetical protein [Verrucomicrobium spinosum]|nr:hypothetical protein [Verrucomicrobium spinosum]
MARELQKHLKVPVGLINASWGGTRIEPGFLRQASRDWSGSVTLPPS